jgi:transposase
MARTKPWKVSDEFWEKVEPLIPAAPSHAKGGRTRMDDRDAFAAMIYVLRTGIQWNAMPRQMGASSTVHERYQEWERAGLFEELARPARRRCRYSPRRRSRPTRRSDPRPAPPPPTVRARIRGE